MKKSFLLLPLVAGLTACGGGSDSSSTSTTPPVPPTAVLSLPSVISGELTQYAVDTGAATVGNYNVNLADLPVQRSMSAPELHVGMVLTLQTDGASKVTQIRYDDLLRAPVTGVDITNKTLTMAGMTVQTEGAVWARGLTLETAMGKLVEVSGYMVDDQTIQATYLELEDSFEPGEMQGIVSELDTTAKTFKLGAITVDYSKVPFTLDLFNGEWIEVEGTFDGTILIADKIELEYLDYDDDASMDIEGRVTASGTDWLVINGSRKVSLTPATRYKGRGLSSAADITVGMHLDIEGVWHTSSKTLIAYEVELDDDDDFDDDFDSLLLPPTTNSHEFEVEGKATYDAGARMLSINGFPFQITSRTELEGAFSFEQLTGLWVSISGYNNLAMEVDVERMEGTIELEGVVAADNTLWGYQANDGSLNNLAGRYVQVECIYQGGASEREVYLCRLELDD